MSASATPRVLAPGLRGQLAGVGPELAARIDRLLGPTRLRRWLAICAGLVGLGVITGAQTITPGAESFGTGPVVEWGALIAGYVLFAVTTSGLCLVSSLGHVFGLAPFRPIALRALVLAILCLIGAFAIIALDLHDPIRLLFGVVLSPSPTSPMWWMGVVYGGYLVVLLVELGAILLGLGRLARAAGIVATVLAVAAPSTLGAVFWVLVARPFWNAGFVPLQLVVSAILSGSAGLAVVVGLVTRARWRGVEALEAAGTVRGVAGLLAVIVAATLVTTVAQSAWRLVGPVDEPLRRAAEGLVAGPLWPVFWTRLVGGLVAPFLILLVARGRTPTGLLVAGSLALVGLVADRYGFVAAAQIAPASTAAGLASGTWADYLPTVVEIGIVAGAFGLVAIAFTLAERVFDLSHGNHA